MSGLFKRMKDRIPKRPIPVFLGDIAVAPRSGIKRYFEVGWTEEQTDEALRSWIAELLEMPIYRNGELTNKVYVLDIFVTHYQCGTDVGIWSNPMLPIFWRPSVTIAAKLRMADRNVLGTCRVTKSMSWWQTIRNIVNPTKWFILRSVASENDMKTVLAQGLVQVLDALRKAA